MQAPGVCTGAGLSAGWATTEPKVKRLSRFVYVPAVVYAEYDHDSFIFFDTIKNAVGA